MSETDFRRVFTILMDIWDKAGEKAIADGLEGQDIVRAQETTLESFFTNIHNTRKGAQ